MTTQAQPSNDLVPDQQTIHADVKKLQEYLQSLTESSSTPSSPSPPTSSATTTPLLAGTSTTPSPAKNSQSIADLIARLPPTRGMRASLTKYFEEMKKISEDLDKFHNSKRYTKRFWDMKKAMEAEFDIIVDRMMHAFGGSIGHKREENDKVLVAVGNSKFSYKKGLESMDGTFTRHLTRKVSRHNAQKKIVSLYSLALLLLTMFFFCNINYMCIVAVVGLSRGRCQRVLYKQKVPALSPVLVPDQHPTIGMCSLLFASPSGHHWCPQYRKCSSTATHQLHPTRLPPTDR